MRWGCSVPAVIRLATTSLDRDAAYRVRAAEGRSVSMAPPPPGVKAARMFSPSDAWPETQVLIVTEEGRCLGTAQVDGEAVTMVLSDEGTWLQAALERSIAALTQPVVIPMPIRMLFAPGEDVFQRLESADSLMEVVDGQVWYGSETLGSGSRLGVSAVIPDGRRFTDAVAGSGGAEVCAIPTGQLHALMAEEPMLRIQLGHALSTQIAGLIPGERRAKMYA